MVPIVDWALSVWHLLEFALQIKLGAQKPDDSLISIIKLSGLCLQYAIKIVYFATTNYMPVPLKLMRNPSLA